MKRSALIFVVLLGGCYSFHTGLSRAPFAGIPGQLDFFCFEFPREGDEDTIEAYDKRVRTFYEHGWRLTGEGGSKTTFIGIPFSSHKVLCFEKLVAAPAAESPTPTPTPVPTPTPSPSPSPTPAPKSSGAKSTPAPKATPTPIPEAPPADSSGKSGRRKPIGN